MSKSRKRTSQKKESQSIAIELVDQTAGEPLQRPAKPQAEIASQSASNKKRSKCERCHGSLCCRYVTQPIKGPRSMKDFDTLLWQVSHHNTQVFKDDDGWYLLFESVCQHLLDDGRCGIYATRPQICRDHSSDNCEMDFAMKDCCDLLFSDFESLDSYCRQRFKNWDKRFSR